MFGAQNPTSTEVAGSQGPKRETPHGRCGKARNIDIGAEW